jgi:hypothetical protein
MVQRIMSQDLSAPAPRALLHLRDITLRGYQRDDGLFDIEAHLTDAKTYAFPNADRGGRIEAGEPLHEMKMRITVDEDMTITACEAATLHGPHRMCPDITPNFSRLAGLRIGAGFLKAARERVGGVHGCTHLVELLQQLGTTAFQTLYAVRARRARERELAGAEAPSRRPALLNTCHTYASDSPVTQRRWPGYYTGPAEGGPQASDQTSDAAASGIGATPIVPASDSP